MATSILGGISQEGTTKGVLFSLQRILNILKSPAGFDRSLSRQRVTALIESGTVTTVSTVTTVTTVTTVAGITNLAQIDGMQGRIAVVGINLTSWNACVRSRLS